MQFLKHFIAVLLVVLSAGSAWARGGGGCLREGTAVLTPAGKTAIEKLRPGDMVLGITGGRSHAVRVESVTKIEVQRYLEISAAGRVFLATPEHPVMTGPGEFSVAAKLKPGDRIFSVYEGKIRPERISAIRPVKADKPAYNLLVHPGGVFFPEGVAVHNKGCFLPESPILKSDGSQIPISAVKPGDEVMAFSTGGKLVTTKVREVLRAEAGAHFILTTALGALRVTGEHPFYVGNGTYKTVDRLKPGDLIIASDGRTLTPQRILSIEKIQGRIQVYNLRTDSPHTFFAGHIAVHNKGGGGGGCFPAGTPIRTPGGQIAIESLAPGDLVVGLDSEGKQVTSRVETIHSARARMLTLRTSGGILLTTADHPVKLTGGDFRQAGDLVHGAFVDAFEDGRLHSSMVETVSEDAGDRRVFNLGVSEPHVFIASGFVVHNKGGHFSSSRSGSSGRSSSSSDDSAWVFPIFFLIIVIFILLKSKKRKTENLDFVYGSSAVAKKAGKTQKLLMFLSTQDPSVAPEALKKIAESTFRKLQECWGSREYGPMQPLLMQSLYEQHVSQLRGMKRNNEINRVEDLKIEKVDLVNVRYTDKPSQREFTALISASARDYYVDARDGRFLRGDKSAAKFQEFWTFQLMDGKWLLREVEQSGESDYLKDENFAEMLTDQNVQKIYGEEAGKEGAAGPWLEKGVEKKAVRIERTLNFLAQTDRLWNRQVMIESARRIFLAVYLARETGDPGQVPESDLFAEVAESLKNQLNQWQMEDMRVEYRNLCVRKVELILIKNFQQRDKDEFIVRISAHAQKIVSKAGRKLSEDKYVMPFEDFWTFGRSEEKWKLKEVLPAAEGKKRLTEENIDEDSSAGQLEWYYRQTRAN